MNKMTKNQKTQKRKKPQTTVQQKTSRRRVDDERLFISGKP
jgi:hypothetical protein